MQQTNQRFAAQTCVGLFAATVLCVASSPVSLAADLATAQRLLLTGRYAEAAEQFAELADSEPVKSALGVVSCHNQQGEYAKADELLGKAAAQHPEAAGLPAKCAELAFARGDYPRARKLIAKALAIDEQQLTARWLQAELHRVSGELEKADKAYHWFVEYYNQADQIEDPDSLRIIGWAAAQYARWNRLTDQFSFLVNELLPDALEQDENYWPARYDSGLLFLEKFNQAEAARELKAALAINANSADVHAALAELAIQSYNLDAAERSIRHALAINPQHLRAMQLRADYHLANFQPEIAVGVLESALKLNPVNEDTLGRLAAAYGMVDGLAKIDTTTRMGKLIAEAQKRNQHCGSFFYALAGALDKGRKFPHAAQYFDDAVRVMPQLVGPRGQAGLMYMRLGDEPRARKLLEASFDIDPFNVRVSNSIKVLEVLDGYETIETEHFVLRYDAARDKILARYMAQYLEAIYPELCRRLDFEPPEKSLFEIFNQARNTNGHGWFSARMVGLPAIHTIGACAGKMVALTSPSSMPKPFNWARVLKHEFVHVINLQQTNYNIPHWFTEALAVLIEDGPRPNSWNEMLSRRVPAGEVFNLDSINLGFIRPSSSEDWQMAYCQAEIYAEYMVEKYGEASLGKMLAAYRDNLNTADAIRRCFDVEQEEFERGYSEHLGRLVDSLPPGTQPAAETSFSSLLKQQATNPDDLELAAQLAAAHLRRKSFPKAGQMADRVLAKQPKHQLATYVKARLLITIGETRRAHDMLRDCLDPKQPQPEVLRLLAGLRYRAEDYEGAELLFKLGAKTQSGDPKWLKSLAMVYLKTGEKAKLTPILAQLAAAEIDDLVLRKKLLELAREDEDHAEAANWANQCLHIDVQDAQVHAALAEALAGQEKFAAAIPAYQTALELDPEQHAWRLALAHTFDSARQPQQAREQLERLLKQKPDYPEAAALLERLKK